MKRSVPCYATLSRLGGYTEFRPPAHLARSLELLWTYQSPEGARATHRVRLNVGVSLCFRYRRGPRMRLLAPELKLIGPVQATRVFAPRAGHVSEAIQLKPEWSKTLLGVTPGEHINAQDAWRLIDGPRVGHLLDALMRGVAECGSALPALLEWLEHRMLDARPDRTTRLANGALERLLGRHGGRPEAIESVADGLGVTARHLRRSVRATASATPKYLQRVERLNRTVAEADLTQRPRWSSLAVGHGYYDQAYLIQEFRALTGRTPVVVHAERRAEHVPFFQSTPDPED